MAGGRANRKFSAASIEPLPRSLAGSMVEPTATCRKPLPDAFSSTVCTVTTCVKVRPGASLCMKFQLLQHQKSRSLRLLSSVEHVSSDSASKLETTLSLATTIVGCCQATNKRRFCLARLATRYTLNTCFYEPNPTTFYSKKTSTPKFCASNNQPTRALVITSSIRCSTRVNIISSTL